MNAQRGHLATYVKAHPMPVSALCQSFRLPLLCMEFVVRVEEALLLHVQLVAQPHPKQEPKAVSDANSSKKSPPNGAPNGPPNSFVTSEVNARIAPNAYGTREF